jgi:hypothetical protein
MLILSFHLLQASMERGLGLLPHLVALVVILPLTTLLYIRCSRMSYCLRCLPVKRLHLYGRFNLVMSNLFCLRIHFFCVCNVGLSPHDTLQSGSCGMCMPKMAICYSKSIPLAKCLHKCMAGKFFSFGSSELSC